jgi:FkbM family methyltransferase
MKPRLPILKRLIPSIKKKLAAIRHPDGFLIERRNGILLLLNYRNYVDRQIVFYGAYEQEQIDFLLAAMRERGGDVFLDIGANFGLYALSVAHARACDRVIAFEPDPRNFNQLSGNLYLNRLEGAIEVEKLAVTDSTGTVYMDMYADTSTGQSRVSEDTSAVPVAAIRLDDFLSVDGKRLFLKIDVEGHELNVIQGMAGLLRNNDCFLQVESFDSNLEKLSSVMAGFGYSRLRRIGSDNYFAKSA